MEDQDIHGQPFTHVLLTDLTGCVPVDTLPQLSSLVFWVPMPLAFHSQTVVVVLPDWITTCYILPMPAHSPFLPGGRRPHPPGPSCPALLEAALPLPMPIHTLPPTHLPHPTPSPVTCCPLVDWFLPPAFTTIAVCYIT